MIKQLSIRDFPVAKSSADDSATTEVFVLPWYEWIRYVNFFLLVVKWETSQR